MAETKKKQAEALKGVKQILMFRLLENKSKESAQKLLFQVEHSNDMSADADATVTKDGNLNNEGAMEEEFTVSSILALGDETADMLEEAMRERKKVELWEINTQDEADQNKFHGKYMQGLLTSFTRNANSEDYVELEFTYKVDLVPQKGECTLTDEQVSVVQYPFRDTTPDIEEV